MKQKVQVHALPTDKADINCIVLHEDKWYTIHNLPVIEVRNPHHLYFTTDEEIKDGDWVLQEAKHYGEDAQDRVYQVVLSNHYQRKIVATTNPDLYFQPTEMKTWSDDSPNRIPQDFIQYFVEKQGNVKEVMLEYEQLCHQTGQPCGFPCNGIENCKKSIYLKFNSDGSVIWSPVEERKYTSQDLEDAFYAGRKQVDHPAFIIYEYSSFRDYKRNLK